MRSVPEQRLTVALCVSWMFHQVVGAQGERETAGGADDNGQGNEPVRGQAEGKREAEQAPDQRVAADDKGDGSPQQPVGAAQQEAADQRVRADSSRRAATSIIVIASSEA